MSGGSSSGAPGGGATGAVVGGGAGTAGLPNGGASLLRGLRAGLPLPVHDHETPSTGGELDDYLRTQWAADHLTPGADAHPEYLTLEELPPIPEAVDAYTKTESDARYPQLTDADPYAQYLTAARGDALFLTAAEGDAAYAPADHTHAQVTTGRFHFQTNPAMTKPGTGNFRSNTGAAATATALAMDEIGALGTDITPLYQAMRLGDTIFVQDLNDADQWVRYQLTGAPTLSSGWAQVPVTVISSGGTIAGSQLCVMQLTLTAGGGGGGGTDYLTQPEADALYVPLAHTALPDAHHAQGHNHTAADGSGALTDEEHDGFSQYANLGSDPATPATNRIRLYAKDNGSGVATLYYRTESGAIYELPTLTTGGGGGSGAPANAGYVTLAAENKLSGEAVLGAAVIMSGVLASRPAFGTAGRLYLGTDTDLVYRDTGSAWETFATRAAGGGGGLATTGGTMTGALTLQGAATTTNVLQSKLAADTGARFRFDTEGKLEWGAGAGSYDVSLTKGSGQLSIVGNLVPATNGAANLGANSLRWGSVTSILYQTRDDSGSITLGSTNNAAAGSVRLRNAATINWRNAAANGDLSLTMNASDHPALTVGAGALTTTVGAAGGAAALPATPTGYVTVTLNGTARKIPYYAT